MSAFQGMPVLVIGGLGFIGSNLTRRLVTLGARVSVITPSRERHAALVSELEAQGVEAVEGDLRDHSLVSRAVAGPRVAHSAPAPNSASKTAPPRMRARREGRRAAIRKPPSIHSKHQSVSPGVKNASVYP